MTMFTAWLEVELTYEIEADTFEEADAELTSAKELIRDSIAAELHGNVEVRDCGVEPVGI
jgi:hypothetical protein